MKFKFYYKAYIMNNEYKYYKIINETNLEKAKLKFSEFINKRYEKTTKIKVIKIEKIDNNKIYEVKEGEENVWSNICNWWCAEKNNNKC